MWVIRVISVSGDYREIVEEIHAPSPPETPVWVGP